MSRSSKFARVL